MNKRQRIGLTLTAAAIMYLGVPAFAPAQEVTTEAGGGGGAVFVSNSVDVHIYADAHNTPLIEGAIRSVERAMPERGPHFNIRRHDQVGDCLKIRRKDFKRPTITFCERESMAGSGTTVARAQHHVFKNDRVWVEALFYSDEEPGIENLVTFDRNTACHEMMHAVSYVNDNYAYTEDSCVQGQRPDAGPWDVEFLAATYAKHDDKAHRKQHERRRDDREGRRGGKQGGRK